jgi:hypothetical protein
VTCQNLKYCESDRLKTDYEALQHQWTDREELLMSRIAELEAHLEMLYSLVRKQGMDDDFRRRIEALIPAYAVETQRDGKP